MERVEPYQEVLKKHKYETEEEKKFWNHTYEWFCKNKTHKNKGGK